MTGLRNSLPTVTVCLLSLTLAASFQTRWTTPVRPLTQSSALYGRRTLVKEMEAETLSAQESYRKRVEIVDDWEDDDEDEEDFVSDTTTSQLTRWTTAAAAAATALTVASSDVLAATPNVGMTPQNFQPVCPTSDVIYRLLQSSVLSIVGKENFIEYAPLISGGLLRIRLEICVVESFFDEAVGPFIAKNGFSWIFPVHETVETFLAGTIFAAATSFILIGSTKIISVLATYGDFLLGVPTRWLGGFFFDRASGKPVTLDVGMGPLKTRLIGPPEEEEKRMTNKLTPAKFFVLIVSGVVKLFGQAVGLVQKTLYGLDNFVGKYLFVWATLYILFKFVHFKFFPDFP